MAIERINPAGLASPSTYTHVVRALSGTTVYISGQVPLDASGALVGAGDLGAQARQVFANLGTALAAAGGNYADIVKITTYVVGYRPEAREVVNAARREAFGDVFPASTLLGVQALAVPEFLIEIEAVAVIG